MVFGAVVAVEPVLQEHPELDGMHRFVGVHGAPVQAGRPQGNGDQDDRQEDQCVDRRGTTSGADLPTAGVGDGRTLRR